MLEPTSSVRSRVDGGDKSQEGWGDIPQEVICILYVLLVGTDCGDTFQHIF